MQNPNHHEYDSKSFDFHPPLNYLSVKSECLLKNFITIFPNANLLILSLHVIIFSLFYSHFVPSNKLLCTFKLKPLHALFLW